jgi:hypothetical protein
MEKTTSRKKKKKLEGATAQLKGAPPALDH